MRKASAVHLPANAVVVCLCVPACLVGAREFVICSKSERGPLSLSLGARLKNKRAARVRMVLVKTDINVGGASCGGGVSQLKRIGKNRPRGTWKKVEAAAV